MIHRYLDCKKVWLHFLTPCPTDYCRIGTLFLRRRRQDRRRQGLRHSKLLKQDCPEEINTGLLCPFHRQ